MTVDTDPFPLAIVGIVDAHLLKSKGKRKAEFVLLQQILKQNSRPRIKIELFSNEPPTKFSGPAIVESMSDSNTEKTDGPMVLCGSCKACVILTEPKEKPPHTPVPWKPSKAATTSPKELGGGQCQKVFDRLSPKKRTDSPTSARQRLDFDAPFYNEDYYSSNSNSSSSSMNKKTFKPPKSRYQRWYSYNSPTSMYTALSKSQKRRRQ
ncbi:hypothetical protein ACFXTI_026679 [Malus domestica]